MAGVEADQIEVEVGLDRIWIRGYREAPEPLQQLEMPFSTTRKPVRVVTMEINHGRFEREVEVPAGYDPRKNYHRVGKRSFVDLPATNRACLRHRSFSRPSAVPKF